MIEPDDFFARLATRHKFSRMALMNEFSFRSPPKDAGGYRIGSQFIIMIREKPAALHRYFCRILLGWTWEDSK